MHNGPGSPALLLHPHLSGGHIPPSDTLSVSATACPALSAGLGVGLGWSFLRDTDVLDPFRGTVLSRASGAGVHPLQVASEHWSDPVLCLCCGNLGRTGVGDRESGCMLSTGGLEALRPHSWLVCSLQESWSRTRGDALAAPEMKSTGFPYKNSSYLNISVRIILKECY